MLFRSLHFAVAALPLQAQLLFSSVGSALGNVGQTNYAASNACLDSHALARRTHGVEGYCVQWPLVGGAGMGAAVLASMEGRESSIAGMAGISLDHYAECIGRQLSTRHGVFQSVQLVHRHAVEELLHDLFDSSQPRFGDLVEMRSGSSSGAQALPPTQTGSVAPSAIFKIGRASCRERV